MLGWQNFRLSSVVLQFKNLGQGRTDCFHVNGSPQQTFGVFVWVERKPLKSGESINWKLYTYIYLNISNNPVTSAA